ncbi:PREDICTED: uncharacterized protein LOC108552497 [Eufriesea mexicana]|uniref:uncharacterized protein LOC108552497 n=1 Tax=Eufriesea mexicana TaxID=516756 RepID=UPI00083BE833|nr:PREDICTED: uncharacterized protein LOC108552497 [Eufriesea mexicana]
MKRNLKNWDEWDDNNHAARLTIKQGMAVDTKGLKARSLNELSIIKVLKEETVETFLNRTEALKNQCIQLGKKVEDYEFKMYVLRGLRPEYDPNVREEIRRAKRKEEKTNKEYGTVRKVKEGNRTDSNCYNCVIKGHIAADSNRSEKCFNCEGFNYIAANCRERKKNATPMRRGTGGSFYGGYCAGNVRQYRGREDSSLNTREEAVMRVSEISKRDKLYEASSNNNLKLKNELYVPELNSNLISVAKITHHGYDVNFNTYGAIVYNKLGGIQMTAVRKQDVYYVRTSINLERTVAVSTVNEVQHKRLGYANKEIVEEMRRKSLALGMDSSWIKVCEPCVQGKARKKPHPRQNAIRTKRILELWHTD